MRTEIRPDPGSQTETEERDAVLRLLECLDDRSGALQRAGGHLDVDGAVLLDVTLGDIRCLVVRVMATEPPRAHLSPREQEIARMVSQGYTNKTIAGVLDISLWTVSTHLRRIFAKLGVSTRAAMVATVLTANRE